MTDEEKAVNRWNVTKWTMGFTAFLIIAMLVSAWAGKTEAVKSMENIVLGLLAFGAALMGVNYATPAGGIKR